MPPIAWHLASCEVVIRISPPLSGKDGGEHPPPPVRVQVLGGRPHCLAGAGWVATCTLPASSPEPILAASWGVSPSSWAEKSDSLDAKMGINRAWASICDLHIRCSEAAMMWDQASTSRRRLMEKCTEWEIHFKKASTTCVLITCMVCIT